MTYERLKAHIAGGRTPDKGRPLGNNTRAECREGGAIAVRLHATDVVTAYPDGRVVLNDGGWVTHTTKARMIDHLPPGWRLYSDRGQWWVAFDGTAYPYADGITLRPDGTCEGAGTDPKATQKLRKRVLKYADGYAKAFAAGAVEAPGLGDCFYCSMREAGKVGADARTLGEMSGNADHLLSHLDEAYYVPSLLSRALETVGASQAVRQYVASYWDPTAPADAVASVRRCWGDLGREQIRRAVRRYMLRGLSLPA